MVVTLTEIMPREVRTSGFSVAYSLATSVFGGLTPVIATFIVQQTGSKTSPAFWLMFAAVLSLITVLTLFKQMKLRRVTA